MNGRVGRPFGDKRLVKAECIRQEPLAHYFHLGHFGELDLADLAEHLVDGLSSAAEVDLREFPLHVLATLLVADQDRADSQRHDRGNKQGGHPRDERPVTSSPPG